MLPRFAYILISYLKLKIVSVNMIPVRYTSALLRGHVLYTHMLVRAQECEKERKGHHVLHVNDFNSLYQSLLDCLYECSINISICLKVSGSMVYIQTDMC